MATQGSLGSLLQGVSQQPARIRLPGQVSEQVNMVSDVSTGLSSRPAVREISVLPNATGNLAFYHLTYQGQVYIVGHRDQTIRVWGLDGTEYQVIVQDAAARNYLSRNMRFHVFGDKVYCTNRDRVVEKEPATVGRPFHVALVSALGGNYSRTYTVTITFPNGVVKIGSYTTPDGDTPGDAEKTTSEYIIDQIRADLVASGPPAGTIIEAEKDVLLVRFDDTLRVSVADGEGGTILRAMSDFIDKQSDLPRFAPEGTIVRVIGDVADEDDYFLRFNADTTSVPGDGFGDQGVWEEWFNPDQPKDFKLSTMPHVLFKDGNDFKFERNEFLGRRVGDDDSNPFPSFVGNSIRDIGGFESRLVLTAGPNVIMSRTNRPDEFWRKSATVLIDSDPIDMKSTREGSVTLDWIVPFDRDLILLADPGDSQFVVTGGGLTPRNASLVLSTTYEMFGQARPVTTGRTMIFPFRSGVYSGLKEFFTNDEVATNGADTLTEVQDRYIVGEVDHMASSKNFNLLLLTTDNPETNNQVWVYKYLWEGTERMQSSWSRWTFPSEVRFIFFDNSRVYFIFREGTNNFVLGEMDLNKPLDPVLDYHLCLDRQSVQTVSDGKIVLPYAGATFVQYTGCPNIGIEATPILYLNLGNNIHEYYFDMEIYADGMEMIAGNRYERFVEPTMPQVKDDKGSTVSSAKIVVTKFFVHVEKTGAVQLEMTSPHRSGYVFNPFRYPLDDEPLDPGRTQLNSKAIEVPWGERSDWSKLVVRSSDIRPTTILEIEWEAQIRGVKRRL